MKKFLKTREFTLLLMIIFLIIIISIISPVFLTLQNFINIFKSNIVLAIISMGMTVLLITGSIDVSVGSQLAVLSVIISKLTLIPDVNIFIIIIASIIMGILLSSINGFISIRANIPPIVVSFGTMGVYRGAILLYTNGVWVMSLPAWFTGIWRSYLGIPIPFYIFTIFLLLSWFMLNNTKIGRQIFAMGGNKNAALRAGINIKNTTMFAFMYLGILMGIGSILYTAQTGFGSPVAGSGLEMSVIAAVIIGGASVYGGRGSIFATTLGVLLISIIQNGLVLMRVSLYYQNVVNALIIIIAVTSDVLRQRKEKIRAFIIDIDEKEKTILKKI